MARQDHEDLKNPEHYADWYKKELGMGHYAAEMPPRHPADEQKPCRIFTNGREGKEYSSMHSHNDRAYLEEQCSDEQLQTFLKICNHETQLIYEFMQSLKGQRFPINVVQFHLENALREVKALVKDELKNRIDKL